MVEILTHAGCFIGIILLGWALRRVGFFKESDFHVLSKIVIKITLTAAIVTNFSGREMQTSMLLLTLMGFGFGVLMMIVGSVMYLPQGRERQAFAMLNASGCNIGNFAMPFAQGFLGPVGVIAVSLFDCGNSMICLGGAYSIASIVKSGDGKFRIKPILNNLVHSIPLMTYIFMTILGLLHLSLPAPVVEFAGIVRDNDLRFRENPLHVAEGGPGADHGGQYLGPVLGGRDGVFLRFDLRFQPAQKDIVAQC